MDRNVIALPMHATALQIDAAASPMRRSLSVLLALTLSSPVVAVDVAPPGTEEEARGALAAESLAESPLPELEDAEPVPAEEAHLPPKHRQWLRQVEPLITRPERALFLSLHQDYQRDAFIEEFWKPRDPYPRTVRNELKERWPLRIEEARTRFGSLEDDRARVYLIHGPPTGGFSVDCTQRYSPIEVWGYEGSESVDFPFTVVFVQRRMSGEARVWRPGLGFGADATLERARSCINGRRMQQVISLLRRDVDHYERTLRLALAKPKPRSEEWIASFAAFSTDVADGAPRFDGTLDLAYPGRIQHRTAVQAVVAVDASAVAAGEIGGYRSYEFRLVGEILKDGDLFESFRYQFGFPDRSAPDVIPLAFQRRLRPGDYRMILRVDDLHSDRVLRLDRELSVPDVDEELEAERTFVDARTEALLAEARDALETGENVLRIVPPLGDLLTGFVRFDTLAVGDRIERVRFLLDDEPVLTRNRPPWNVEIDLGDVPAPHRLRAEALDSDGREIAGDEIVVNGGDYRFQARLIEPRSGKRYVSSIPVRADVEIPEGRTLDRVEIFLDEERVAVLYQEPFEHPVVVPPGTRPTFVRAVAYLPDGNSTEDLVFVNAPEQLEEIDVQLVELYTTVLDGQGRPVEGLDASAFRVFENGTEQSIARFETVRDLPIHVAVLLDNSASMAGVLGEVRRAALTFFDAAITPKDRAAVVTFNAFPRLATELTNDRLALGQGLAGLAAEGRTALWDSVMFSLYYLTGVKGQRAILLLSDGKDEASRFEFDQALDYARRAGVTVYTIAFGATDPTGRGRLGRLAEETGGRSFHLRDIEGLESLYATIQRELRSQYLVAYQSADTSDDESFRSVDLRVERSGVEVKTISGYYP